MEDDHTVEDFYNNHKDSHQQGNNNNNMMSAPNAAAPPMMMRGGFPPRQQFGGYGGGMPDMDRDSATISTTSAYVGNLHPTCTKEDLMNHFASCGTMRRVTIPVHPSGQMRGCGYLEFESPDGLHRSLQLHNTVLKGNTIEVYAKRDTHRRGGRGGGRGFGGGRGMYGGPMPMFMPQYGISPYPMPSYGQSMAQMGPLGGGGGGAVRTWGAPRGSRGGIGGSGIGGGYPPPGAQHHF